MGHFTYNESIKLDRALARAKSRCNAIKNEANAERCRDGVNTYDYEIRREMRKP